MGRLLFFVAAAICWACSVTASDLSARARLDPGGTFAVDDGSDLLAEVFLTQGVPWRVFTVSDPARIVLEFREVNWEGLDAIRLTQAQGVASVAATQTAEGWSRLELVLARPMTVEQAEMITDPERGDARVSLRMVDTTAEDFAISAVQSVAGVVARTPKSPAEKLHVVLDPGHGGVDPGAEADGLNEADLMLTFAREVQDVLIRTGRFKVTLTRNSDEFVALERRVAIAHEVQADLFLSLHADALPEGHAAGSTVYTLSEMASDVASEKLAERHQRDALLKGVDLTGQDDTVARVLMEIIRTETQPRSDELAGALVEGLEATLGHVNNRPHRHAGLSVLKSADIPSALIEVAFMTDPKGLANLRDARWRAKAAAGLLRGIEDWRQSEAAAAGLLRR